MDGMFKSTNKVVGCGGLLRDDDGRWIIGYSKALGSTTSYVAELWGPIGRFRIGKKKLGYNMFVFHMDFSVFVDIIKNKGNVNVSGWNLVKKIQSLLSMNWSISFIMFF